MNISDHNFSKGGGDSVHPTRPAPKVKITTSRKEKFEMAIALIFSLPSAYSNGKRSFYQFYSLATHCAYKQTTELDFVVATVVLN